MDEISNGNNLEWTRSRRTRSRTGTISNGHDPEWTRFRMDTIPGWTRSPDGHDPEETQTIPHWHNPEYTLSRMDTIPIGQDPEW